MATVQTDLNGKYCAVEDFNPPLSYIGYHYADGSSILRENVIKRVMFEDGRHLLVTQNKVFIIAPGWRLCEYPKVS